MSDDHDFVVTSNAEDRVTAMRVIDSMERMHGGPYPGYRRSGARGVCFKGTFTPTGDAAALTTAAHLQSLAGAGRRAVLELRR